MMFARESGMPYWSMVCRYALRCSWLICGLGRFLYMGYRRSMPVVPAMRRAVV